MKKSMKYETPEIEVTKFDLDRAIMGSLGEGGDGHDGDIIPVPGASDPEGPGDLWGDLFGDD